MGSLHYVLIWPVISSIEKSVKLGQKPTKSQLNNTAVGQNNLNIKSKEKT